MEIEINYSQSEQVGDLVAALAKAKLKYGEVTKSKRNKYTDSMYADLQDLMNAAERALAEEGLVVVHFPIERIEQKKAGALTKLIHASGQFFGNQFLMPATGKATGGAEKLDAQTVTGGVTYAKRCNYGALVGLVGETDDDGDVLADKSEPGQSVAKPTTIAAPAPNRAPAKKSQEARPNEAKSAPKAAPELPPAAPAAPQASDPAPVAPSGPPPSATPDAEKTPPETSKPVESTVSKAPELAKPTAGTEKPNKSQLDAYILRVRDDIKPKLEKAGLQPSAKLQTGAKLKNFILFRFGGEAKDLTDLTVAEWEAFLNYYEITNDNAAIVAEIEKGGKG